MTLKGTLMGGPLVKIRTGDPCTKSCQKTAAYAPRLDGPREIQLTYEREKREAIC